LIFALDKQIQQIKQDIQQLDSRFNLLVKQVNSAINALNIRLSQLEYEFELRINQLIEAFKHYQNELNRLEIKINDNFNFLSGDITKVEYELLGKIKALNTDLLKHITDINLHNSMDINQLKALLNNVETSINQNTDKEINQLKSLLQVEINQNENKIDKLLASNNSFLTDKDVKKISQQTSLLIKPDIQQIPQNFYPQLQGATNFLATGQNDIQNNINKQNEKLQGIFNYFDKDTNNTNKLNTQLQKQNEKLNQVIPNINIDYQKINDNLKNTMAPLFETVNQNKSLNQELLPLVIMTAIGTQTLQNTGKKLLTNTDFSNLTTAAKNGACNALNSGCGQSQFGNTLNKAINPLNTALSGADLIQNSVLLRKIDNTVNTIKNTTDTITKKVKGLYDNLGVDRALKIIDTALLFHNASMLSYNLFQTLGDTIDITLQALNIPFKDEEGNNLEFTQFINSSIKDFVINIVGQETYTNTVVTWNSINRIYQSGANLLYATRSLFDESLDYSEMIGEMLGKFMNTAKKDGLVKEDSYPTQKENLPPKSKYRKNFENFNENLEDAETALDSIAMVSASTLGIVSEFREIQETSLEFKNVMNEETTALDNIYNQEKSNSVINVDIDRSDIESTL
jgi:hypothetical protein